MALSHNPRIVTDGLVLCLDAANPKSYPGSGTVWKDLSGNGNDGTLVNGVGYSSDNNGSLSFDGSNDYVSVSSLLGFDFGQSISVLVWNFNAGGAYRGLVNNGYFFLSGGFELRYGREDYFGGINNGTRLGTIINTNNDSAGINIYSELNAWGYFGLVYDGSYVKVYKNGELLDDPVPLTGNIEIDNNNPIFIGQNSNNGQYFNSDISQVSIYNRALTEAEIKQNFNALRGRYGL